MGKLFDVAIINLLWIATSLPIITAGVSTAAVFTAVYDTLENDEGSAAGRYFRAFKENWKQGSILMFLTLTALVILGFDLVYFGYLQNYLAGMGQTVVCTGVGILLLFTFAVSIYAFSLQAFFENSVIGILRSAMVLALGNMMRTLLLLLTNGVYLTATLLVTYFFPGVSVIFLLFGVGFPAFIDGLVLLPVIKKHLPPDAGDQQM